VATLAVDSVALVVETDTELTEADARLPSEAVETPLNIVAPATVTGTDVVIVAAGAKVKRPILFPIHGFV
jgi:hypothetical protein